jgi:hypothetical protein
VRINGRPRERFLLLAARRNLTVCNRRAAEETARPAKASPGKSCHLRQAVPVISCKNRHSRHVAAMARRLLRRRGDDGNAAMQISSAGSYYGLTSPSPASSPVGPSGASGGTTASNSTAASQDNSVVQDFLNYAKMSPAERLRASILKGMGLTEQQLDQMPPAQRQAVEQKIEEIIKQKLQQNGGQPGQLVNASA